VLMCPCSPSEFGLGRCFYWLLCPYDPWSECCSQPSVLVARIPQFYAVIDLILDVLLHLDIFASTPAMSWWTVLDHQRLRLGHHWR
jgi:hypothetical protein